MGRLASVGLCALLLVTLAAALEPQYTFESLMQDFYFPPAPETDTLSRKSEEYARGVQLYMDRSLWIQALRQVDGPTGLVGHGGLRRQPLRRGEPRGGRLQRGRARRWRLRFGRRGRGGCRFRS